MKNLPINKIIPDIKNCLKDKSRLIVQAPPGAGKSTVVPISLLNEDWLEDKIIVLLEPRRIAARMLASLMAKFLNEEVGETIGYQIKMDTCKSSKTKVLVVTEAILVRMLQSNQSLDHVGLIIFDEFHERSIHTDLSLALSLQVQELLRDDLKLLIMSATLNSKDLSTLLDDAPIIISEGKTFEIENIYLQANTKQPDYKSIYNILLETLTYSLENDKGDILVFLSGVKQINKLESLISDLLKNKFQNEEILLFPLHSNLSKEQQDKAIKSYSKRKIILSTNIAQTSLTIEGVCVVIDTGLEKISYYNHSTAMNYLEETFISKESAVQRAGRAGRLSKGKCYKLWHKNKILQESTDAEILRSDLSSLILDLSLWGVDDFTELKWLDIPKKSRIDNTKIVLQELNMLDDKFQITNFAKESLQLGVHPRFSYMILKAYDMNYAYEACLLASIISNKDIFINSYKDSDLLSRFNIFLNKDFNSSFVNKHRVNTVLKDADFFFNKLVNIKKDKISKNRLNSDILGILVLLAYPDRLAKQRNKDDNKYKLSNGKGAILNIEDTLFNQEFLVVPNLNFNTNNAFINLAICINYFDIEKYFSSYIKEKQTIVYNKENKKIDIRNNKYFFDLELSSSSSSNISNIEFKSLIIDLINKEGLSLLTWNK
ncbi:ATP-dependent helicase HrpB, partial [Poseidonibacter sp.]|uniref:ATP-dependent helicase HrpB n=1 Tax=Poseidonibacter sp. TaxID=2321188 RepID=UPI003C70687F